MAKDLDREKLADDNEDTEFYLLVNTDQALDLASGFVPLAVKAMVTTMLDWVDEDERRAQRPVKARKTRKAGAVDPHGESEGKTTTRV